MANAIVLARALGSELTLLHVLQPPAHPHPDALDWEIARQEARVHLEQLEQQAAHALGRPAAVRLEQGRAAERIVEIAREVRADLTVLGSRGEGNAVARNLGSTVQQVVAVTRGSVFVAHMAPAEPPARSPQRIIVPLDGSPRTESVLPTAAR
ncbi:MAG: universal stress protein, partial [Solirubrobacteraceae bacterium]